MRYSDLFRSSLAGICIHTLYSTLCQREERLSIHIQPWIDDAAFHQDVQFLETRWQRTPIGSIDLPVIDIGQGAPLVFVPILEHLEFVYARQIRTLSQSRRVILYRRQETRDKPVGLADRVAELRTVLDSLGLAQADLLGHGDAAMVLFEFALRYPTLPLTDHYCTGSRLPDRAPSIDLAPPRTVAAP